jgi:hypothetical protein
VAGFELLYDAVAKELHATRVPGSRSVKHADNMIFRLYV